ncbi:MAG: glycine/sarcosine/betaine reductase selenoprotein B family protein [Anaerolineales bacterium]
MAVSTKQVDSYRFLDGLVKRLVRTWVGLEPQRDIPWTPLRKPLKDCTVALLSSAGLALKSDQPFDQEGERQNPWWGDPSYRLLPRDADPNEIALYHLHISNKVVERDINTLIPLERLFELEKKGVIGQPAPHHYSYMGYILQPQVLLEETLPAMIEQMKQDQVDVVLLVPG